MSTSFTYRDIDLSFKKHPLTGDIATVSDETAVKQSIKNLVKLAPFDKPFNREIASPLYGLLFEPIDRVSAASMRIDIKNLLETHETRIEDIEVLVKASPEDNKYEVSVKYRIKKMPNFETVEIFLPIERLK